MDSGGKRPTAAEIRKELASLEAAKAAIEKRISVLEAQLKETSLEGESETDSSVPAHREMPITSQLPSDMIYRYSRHLLLPSFGVEAQANLLKSSVLVIGAGGLGSPALLYLAACGFGMSLDCNGTSNIGC